MLRPHVLIVNTVRSVQECIPMFVGLFAPPERGEDVRTVLRALRTHAIDARGLTIAEAWSAVGAEPLRSLLEQSTHAVLLPPHDRISDWVVFVAGFAAGRSLPVVIIGGTDIPAAYASRSVAISDVENYMLAERSSWEREHRVEEARSRLHGRERDPRTFYEATIAGDTETIEDLLTLGLSANTRSPEGVPVLVGAVRARSVGLVQRLLGAGADANATCGRDGATALSEAASRGLETIVGVLLSRNANPNLVTGSGQSPLMLAASQGHLGVVRDLIAAGARVELRDSLGQSAADYARLFGREEILATLEKVRDS